MRVVPGNEAHADFVGTYPTIDSARDAVWAHTPERIAIARAHVTYFDERWQRYPCGSNVLFVRCGLCGAIDALPVSIPGLPVGYPTWKLVDESPTITPGVMVALGDRANPEFGFALCNYYVQDGHFIALADSRPWVPVGAGLPHE